MWQWSVVWRGLAEWLQLLNLNEAMRLQQEVEQEPVFSQTFSLHLSLASRCTVE
jgi:hypothetical protein